MKLDIGMKLDNEILRDDNLISHYGNLSYRDGNLKFRDGNLNFRDGNLSFQTARHIFLWLSNEVNEWFMCGWVEKGTATSLCQFQTDQWPANITWVPEGLHFIPKYIICARHLSQSPNMTIKIKVIYW